MRYNSLVAKTVAGRPDDNKDIEFLEGSQGMNNTRVERTTREVAAIL
jgi:hypothetical protein